MHEYALTEGILGIVQKEAIKAGATHVDEIVIVIGELSTFVDEYIETYFTEMARGTLAENASLVFQKIEARAGCLNCQAEFRPRQKFHNCPECGSPLFQLKEGNELYIESIEAS